VVGKLLRDGLVEEVSAAASLAWRRDDDAGPRALRVSKRGLAGGQARIGDAARVLSELCSLILCALVRLFRSSTCRIAFGAQTTLALCGEQRPTPAARSA
jgi:hypothetical protein